jgi:hypothetical protein
MPNYPGIFRCVFLVFLCMALSACAGLTTTLPSTLTPPNPKQYTAEIITPTKVLPIIEPSPSNIPTITLEPTPASPSFLHPSDTPAASQHTHNPAEAITATPTKFSELDIKETQVASFCSLCDVTDCNAYNTLLSPKGNWLAMSCGYKRGQTLQVYSKTGKKWVLQFKDYVAKQFIQDGQTPMGILNADHWSSDEIYLYFSSAIGFSGGGTCFYGGMGQGLYRLNLVNGTVTATLPPLIGPDEYILSFAPSGRWLAYYTYTSVPAIHDLQTGKEIVLQEGNNEVGDFVWSPDSSKLAYSTCKNSEDFSRIKKSSVRIFYLKTRESKTILESEAENVFLRIDFGDGNLLKIYDDYTNHPTYSFFDWSSEQFVITPTLTPMP